MSEADGGHVVIVGGGHGGGNAATFLRQLGHTGPVTLISEEAIVPYQRPPLSKAYLKGEVTAENLKIRPDTFYHDKGVTLRLGARVERIDRAAKTLHLEGAGTQPYDKLILATGSRPRRLAIPGGDLQGIHVLRDLHDADGIRAAMQPGHRLVVIGGGYVGLECAASARKLGAEATIIEREPRILARVACAPLAEFFADYHKQHGVEIIAPGGVEAFEGDHGFVTAVRLLDGRRLECDAVLVGIGADACSGLASDAGLECSNGVVVDENARTSDPDIYAIGDMSWRPMPLYDDRRHRLESVPNASEQGRRAAADILGVAQLAHEVPWFWSDQYDLKLQIAGVPFDSDDLVIRGDMSAGKFAIWHVRGDTVLAVEAVNMAAEFMAGKKLIGKDVPRARLADASLSAKELATG